mgnify:CR=1 FL=1
MSSCSFFIKLDQSDEVIVFKTENSQKICRKTAPIVLASQSGQSLKQLKQRLLSVSVEKSLKPIEAFVAWSLLQIYIRPNNVSPGSAIQFMDTSSSNLEYVSYVKKNSNDPFLYFNSLRDILTKYQSKKSLSYLARIVDEIIPSQFTIDKNLATFLAKNKDSITANKRSHRFYSKGQQVLRKGEGLNTFKIWPLISQSRYLKNSTNTHLFSKQIGNGKSAHCNFDMGIYKNSIYLIDSRLGLNSHPFSLSYKGQTFMAISSQIPNSKELYPGTYSFKPIEHGGQKAFCKIKTKNSQLTLISSKGRDSGQHLFNLIEYKISSAENRNDLIELLDFPRYLFLLNPERMVYESNRSSPKQIQTFLNTSFPIYHKSNLGNIWLHYKTTSTKKSDQGLILDGRQENSLSCSK